MSVADLQALERAHAIPTYARLPVAFVRGAGCRLWDDEGNEYLDLFAGLSVSNAGHCHPKVVAAVQEQAARLMHATNLVYTAPAMRLSQRLAERSLGGKVYLANSGTEAVEAALKLARKRRPGGGFVSVHRGFHGRTYGALSATPQESKQAPFAPLVPGFVAVAPDPDSVVAAVDDSTAGVLIEPVQGEGGVHVLSDELVRAAREACDRTGAALIFDEIQCGMGRTGTLWAYEQVGVRPDLMTLAKALGGGMPIGALVAAPAFADALEPGDHGSTFAGNPVVCAAALATLDVIDDESLLARVSELGERLTEGLRDLPGVREVRGRGLMLAAEIDGAPELARCALLEQRLVVNAPGPTTLRLLPPLVISEEEVDEGLARLRRLLG